MARPPPPDQYVPGDGRMVLSPAWRMAYGTHIKPGKTRGDIIINPKQTIHDLVVELFWWGILQPVALLGMPS